MRALIKLPQEPICRYLREFLPISLDFCEVLPISHL